MNTNTAITGIGIICALGADSTSVLENIKAHKSGIKALGWPEHGLQTCAGIIHPDLLPSEDSIYDRSFRLLFKAVLQAAQNAHLMPQNRPRDFRLALVAGTPKAGIGTWEKNFKAMKSNGAQAISPDFAANIFPVSGTTELARQLKVRGPVISTASACNSGISAIELAAAMIDSGKADAVIAGCAESSLSPLVIGSYKNMGVLCPDSTPEAFCPFDQKRKGFFIGEGAGAVVLESRQSAKRRGVKPQGTIRAAFANSESYAPVAQDPSAQAVYDSVTDMLKRAGLAPEDIDYVNLHGSGTKSNDTLETALLEKLFKTTQPYASSTKPFTGHLLSASGIVEIIISLICARGSVVPENINLKNPVPGFEKFSTNETRKIRNFISMNFGFGSSIGAVAASLEI